MSEERKKACRDENESKVKQNFIFGKNKNDARIFHKQKILRHLLVHLLIFS